MILVVVALDVHKLLYPVCIINIYVHRSVLALKWRCLFNSLAYVLFYCFFFIIFCFINITNQTLDLLLWAIFFLIACYVIIRPQSKCETTRIRD